MERNSAEPNFRLPAQIVNFPIPVFDLPADRTGQIDASAKLLQGFQ